MIGNTMTAPWPQRKPRGLGLAISLATSLILVTLGSAGPVRPVGAATTQRVVVDRHTGLAINGFDPVAYFTDRTAIEGKGEFEQALAGAVWRFRNDGNRTAFMADPDVYMPRFGGYDPVSIARGVAVPGNPELWFVSGDRLYLFYTAEARDQFVNDSRHLAAAADRAWPAVENTLAQ